MAVRRHALPGEFKVTVEVDGKVADTMDNVHSKLSEVVELNFDLKKTSERS